MDLCQVSPTCPNRTWLLIRFCTRPVPQKDKWSNWVLYANKDRCKVKSRQRPSVFSSVKSRDNSKSEKSQTLLLWSSMHQSIPSIKEVHYQDSSRPCLDWALFGINFSIAKVDCSRDIIRSEWKLKVSEDSYRSFTVDKKSQVAEESTQTAQLHCTTAARATPAAAHLPAPANLLWKDTVEWRPVLTLHFKSSVAQSICSHKTPGRAASDPTDTTAADSGVATRTSASLRSV